jgi:4-hydroxy-tetrahydrodipicolinate synthase
LLNGVYPIVFVPFHADGAIDEDGLRRIVRFELDGGVNGVGINGFASEAYKLTDDERRRTVEIAAGEIANSVPLIIGIAPGSVQAALQDAREFAKYRPAALMTLPPSTMDNGHQALIDFYVELGNATDIPIMVQQSPHIPAYTHCELPAPALAEIAHRAPNVRYFKIEGPGSAERIQALRPLVDESVGLLGGGGGINLPAELRAGASGVIPGVGFNECFIDVWAKWTQGDEAQAEAILRKVQPLVDAVSGSSHEYSVHVRKQLMKRAGYIQSAMVRRPTVPFDNADMTPVFALADSLNLRISM